MVMGNKGKCRENGLKQILCTNFRKNKIFQWEVYFLLYWTMLM